MNKLRIAGLLALVLLQHVNAAEPVIDTSVDQKARAWLVHLDSGQPDQAWETGSPALRKALALDDWRKALKGVANIGAVQGRALSSVTFTNKIPGGQDGQYALLHYDSVFEHKNRATETVIVLCDADGVWRSAGYFLK